MLKTNFSVLIVLMSFYLSGWAQQERTVGDFTGIKVGNSFNVVISQSDVNTLKIDADEKTLSEIKTEVIEGILVISTEDMKTDKSITIEIGIKSLTSLNVLGSAEVKTENQLQGDKISIVSSGAGDLNLNIKASEINIKNSGAGDIVLKGSADMLVAIVSAAGELKASDLEAQKVKVNVSGVGDAKVYAIQAIDANVSGVGSIIYKGSPAEREVNITGLGSVRESKSGTGEETASDTTKFKLGKKKYMIIGDNKEKKYNSKKDSVQAYKKGWKHWNGIQLGVNGFLDYKNTFNIPDNGSFLELEYAKSLQFALNLFEKDFHLYKNYLNLVTGLGFDFNHYAFKNNITLNADTSYLSASNDNVDYKKNKLNISYIKVPLLLEINTSKKPKKNFHIAGGIEFAYRIHSVAKQLYTVNNKHYWTKQRDDFNSSSFLYSTVVRIGYNKITAFANYGLNRLFQKDKAPQAYPFTAGLTFAW